MRNHHLIIILLLLLLLCHVTITTSDKIYGSNFHILSKALNYRYEPSRITNDKNQNSDIKTTTEENDRKRCNTLESLAKTQLAF